MLIDDSLTGQDVRQAFRKDNAARDEELAMLERQVEFLRRHYPLRFMKAVARATRGL